MTLLAIENLSIAFDEKPVVDDVSFTLAPGEKFALVGESGSGKTVTALSILRLLNAQVSGTITFAGKNLNTASEREMRGLRGADIAMIFQEPMSALNPLYTIGNQIVEVLQLHEGLSAKDAVARSIELLRQTGIPEPEQRFTSYPHQLSGGQRQRAMIAMALACKPKLLIADEPTTALDVSLRGQIIDLLDSLQQQYGMAILLITHDLNLVRRFAQRVGVMQYGKLVEVAPTAELFAAPKADYTKRLLDSRPRKLAPPLPEHHAHSPHWLMEAKHISVDFPIKRGWFKKESFRAVDQVDLHLRPGETLGIVGESGSGKSTLAMALLNLQGMSHGRVRFEGHDLHQLDRDALRTLRASMQVVFQDPFASLSPRMTIEQIVGEGIALHQAELTNEQRRQRVIAMLHEVGLPADILQRYPHEFSGGQRQRIAIARAVILNPALLVLDEPTSALDVSVQKQVLELLAELQRKHQMSYLFISHDLEVIRAMSHRVLVMQGGKVVETGTAEQIFAQPQQAYTKKLVDAVYGYGSGKNETQFALADECGLCEDKPTEDHYDRPATTANRPTPEAMARQPRGRSKSAGGVSSAGAEVHIEHNGAGERAGQSTTAGATAESTRPLDATRTLETSTGPLTYSDVAERLAVNIVHCLDALLDKPPEQISITPEWICAIHQDIAGELFPDWAGRFRTTEVQVGTHIPPAGHEIAVHITNFCLDLEERLRHLRGAETIAELLAWVDWRFQWVHPFKDFNGRVGRILLTALTYRLGLPPIDPADVDETGKTTYFNALRAADTGDQQALKMLWLERLR